MLKKWEEQICSAMVYLTLFLIVISIGSTLGLHMKGASDWIFLPFLLFPVLYIIHIIKSEEEKDPWIIVLKWVLFPILLNTIASTSPPSLIFLQVIILVTLIAISILYHFNENKFSCLTSILGVSYITLVLLPIPEVYWRFFTLGLAFLLVIDFIFNIPLSAAKRYKKNANHHSAKPRFPRRLINFIVGILVSFGIFIGSLHLTDVMSNIEDGLLEPEIHVVSIMRKELDNYPGERTGAICYDGSEADYEGLKTCANNGGVVEWLYKGLPTLENVRKRALKKSWWDFK